jgi:hypothetical protein
MVGELDVPVGRDWDATLGRLRTFQRTSVRCGLPGRSEMVAIESFREKLTYSLRHDRTPQPAVSGSALASMRCKVLPTEVPSPGRAEWSATTSIPPGLSARGSVGLPPRAVSFHRISSTH